MKVSLEYVANSKPIKTMQRTPSNRHMDIETTLERYTVTTVLKGEPSLGDRQRGYNYNEFSFVVFLELIN